jgi:RNA-directed DNA polymerase
LGDPVPPPKDRRNRVRIARARHRGCRKSERATVAAKWGNRPCRDPAEREARQRRELLEGKMAETSGSTTVSTKLQRIAELAKREPSMSITTLAHHVDLNWMLAAHNLTRKNGAVGVDGVTAAAYGERLLDNLRDLHERIKSGSYRAPPVRRVQIPKGDGKETRPIGIPTFEDKVAQRAIAMLLEAVYEQDFMDCSFGFRPKRSPHQALKRVRDQLMEMHGGWVLEIDIRKFFDTLVKKLLMEIVRQRVRDGVVLRMLGKWLHAGVIEDGELMYPEAGTPQGGVISPLLANIYLHEVLDVWFEKVVRPQLRGRATLVRYADDAVMVFENEEDARRVLAVLPKRFEKYGLALHPEKTRLVQFKRPPYRTPKQGGPPAPGTFDLLGFTHYWARSRKNNWVVLRATAKSRLSRSLKAVSQWLRDHRHWTLYTQAETLRQKLQGHFDYYGIPGNSRALARFRNSVITVWRKWLSRRSQNGAVSWAKMKRILERHPLPPALIKALA